MNCVRDGLPVMVGLAGVDLRWGAARGFGQGLPLPVVSGRRGRRGLRGQGRPIGRRVAIRVSGPLRREGRPRSVRGAPPKIDW